jgi:hypothetical protein
MYAVQSNRCIFNPAQDTIEIISEMNEAVHFSKAFAEIGTLCFWDDNRHVDFIKIGLTKGVDRSVKVDAITSQHDAVAFDWRVLLPQNWATQRPVRPQSLQSTSLLNYSLQTMHVYLPVPVVSRELL